MSGHEYRPGTWIALVADGAAALLHPTTGAGLARELWELAQAGSRLDGWLERLAVGGITALPSFAMVQARPEGLGVLVRGPLTVRVGGVEVSGAGYTTWHERLLPGDSFTITGPEVGDPDAEAAVGTWWPVSGGVVLAGGLRGATGALRQPDDAEDDLEVTLLKAPTLAAALGHRPPVPAGGAAGEPARGPAAGAAGEPARGPAGGERQEGGAGAEAVAVESPALTAEPAAEDDYDHLLWSTEQLRRAGAGRDPAPGQGPAPGLESPARAGQPAGAAAEPLDATREPEPDPADLPGDLRGDLHAPAAGSPAPAASSPATPLAAFAAPGIITALPWSRPGAETPPLPLGGPGGAAPHPEDTVLRPREPAAVTGGREPSGATDRLGRTGDTAEFLTLVLPGGGRVEVSGPVLLGRAPEAGRFSGPAPRLVTVANPERDVSGTHAEVRPAGDHVVVTDLGSTNGTVVHLPGRPALRLRPGTGVPVPPDGVVELGTAVRVRIQAPGAAR